MFVLFLGFSVADERAWEFKGKESEERKTQKTECDPVFFCFCFFCIKCRRFYNKMLQIRSK